MDTIEATYRVVTPMFLGGADNEKAEFRLPSFKGALRFWWRALAWRRVNGELRTSEDETPPKNEVLAEIKRQEDELFGSTEGQAKFLLRVDTEGLGAPIEVGEVLCVDGRRGQTVGPGARYLGYGTMHAFASRKKGTEAGELTRECLPAGWTFTVQALLRTDDKKLRQSLQRAFKAVGLFGGLGSKARKGWGSLALESMAGDEHDESTESLKGLQHAIFDTTGGVYHGAKGELPAPYTAFTENSGVYVGVGRKGQAPLELLDELGREMVRERSWGFKGKLFNFSEKAERNYKKDHDLMKRAGRGQKVDEHPDRVAFGLPHNYGRSFRDQVEPAHSERGRRASPLFIKVHEFDDGKPGAVVSFLPAKFLPGDEKLRVGNSREVNYDQEDDDFWLPIQRYISRIAEEGNPNTSLGYFRRLSII